MYKGIVSQITVRPHPNADRLALGLVHGHQVIVGKNVVDGQIGVFFPTDGELSHEFCLAENLYSESALNKLELPLPDSRSFGFFSDRRRVRSQRFRGEKSDGFWIEIQKLAWTGYDLDSLKPGDQIDVLGGVLICQKYYTPATLKAMKRAGQVKTGPEKHVIFPKHIDTEQLRYYINSIPKGSLITITEKLHGTSGRFGLVSETIRYTGFAKWLRRLTFRPTEVGRWVYLNGSKNVNLREETDKAGTTLGFYGTNEFRYNVTRNLTLHKGEILYFEIVGFVREGVPIMQTQPIEDKDLKKTYGQFMSYNYGCQGGEHKLFLYRISRLNQDGIPTELSWYQVRERAKELGLKVVPELETPYSHSGMPEVLDTTISYYLDGSSTLDPTHIREGVVVRVDSEFGTRFYKSKSFNFGVLEGYLKDNDQVVDLEESS